MQSTLLAAAHALAGSQNYPPGVLYVAATPIGNLADIALRTLYTLSLCDLIACEDTRNSGALLSAYGLSKPLLALHTHNERQAAQQVIVQLQRGARIAYISDAGTPCVSDPGAKLVQAVVAAGLRVSPLPGASIVTALLSVAGVDTDGQFSFIGFLPHKGAARSAALARMLRAPSSLVLLESPHRIEGLCTELAKACPLRTVTLGRELTKQFEQIVTLAAAQLPAWLAAKSEHRRGEFALVLHAPIEAPFTAQEDTAIAVRIDALLVRLLQEMPLKSAVAVAVDVLGLPKNQLYERALALHTHPSTPSSSQTPSHA